MQKEKISVIVPIYNVENYLNRCIDSIVNQTYENLEIILVDDGSPDDCGDICEQYSDSDKRIHVIHKRNGGLSSARNIGIEYASSDYIVFVDSDDWLDLNMIELLYNIHKKTNAEIVECSYRNIYSNGIKEETLCSGKVIEADNIFALEGMLDWKYFKPVAWNKLYKRGVIDNIRYPDGKIHEDEFTTYKYFYNAKKLAYVDISKYNYDRSRIDSITGEGFSEKNLDACIAWRERVDFFKDHNITQLERKMNNIYCWKVIDSMYKCYKLNISGERVDRMIKMVSDDIPYLEEHQVDSELIEEFRILKKGIEPYGKYRDEMARA
jgi:glycosyltransferase involved in cell wall biosynthesis